MKKRLKIFIILIILTIFYLYVANITLLPKSITLLQGDKLKFATVFGISLKKQNTTFIDEENNYYEDILETSSIINDNKLHSVRQNEYECGII